MSWMWGKIVLRGSSGGLDGERLGYIDGSYQVLTDALEKDIKSKGVNIVLSESVKTVEKSNTIVRSNVVVIIN